MASVSVEFGTSGANWRKLGGGSWSISWTNDTGSSVNVNSLSLLMGTGSTSGNKIWSSSGQIGPYSGSAMTVNGSTSAGGSASVSVTAAVSVAHYGSSKSDTAWFNYATTSYTLDFGSVFLSADSTITFTLSVGSGGGVVSVRRSGTYYATIGYEVASHTVTFVDGFNGSTITTQTVDHGGSTTPPSAPSHTGYTFTGWSGDYSNVTSDRTITANYSQTNYTLYFDAQSGSVSTSSKTVNYNVAIGTIPTPTRTGYTFSGWFTGTNGEGTRFYSSTNYPYTSNATIYAYWIPINYSITYVANDAVRSPAVMPTNPTTYTKSSAAFTLSNPTRIGYTFIGWTGNGISTPTLYMTVASGSYDNITFTANWRAQLEKNVDGPWANIAVAYRFNGTSWLAVDTKKFNGSSWNKLP